MNIFMIGLKKRKKPDINFIVFYEAYVPNN